MKKICFNIDDKEVTLTIVNPRGINALISYGNLMKMKSLLFGENDIDP
jgi:hypothetical protein